MLAKLSNSACWCPRYLSVAGLLLLAACGGGSGQVAEITGSGNRQGDIEAFGSVFVGGERFSVSGARIEIDGAAANETQLRVGMQATLEVRPGGARIIDRLTANSRLLGLVDQLDVASRRLTLLGQEVLFDDRTIIADPDGLRAGQVVRVFGTELADGMLLAGLIETVAAGSERVAGPVNAVTGRDVTIGNLVIDVSQANSAPLRVGDRISVGGQRVGVNRFAATSVAELPTLPFAPGERAVLGGVVSNYSLAGGSTIEFTLDGTRLRHNDGSDTIINRSQFGLQNGDRVLVDGIADDDGQVILARTITVVSPVAAEVETTISAIDSSAETLTVFGNLTVELGVKSQFVSGLSAGGQAFNFDSLSVGDRIELRLARVNQLASRNQRLSAAELEIARITSQPVSQNELIVAPLEASSEASRQVVVLGQVINIDDSTQFDSHDSEAAFFAAVRAGDELEVELTNAGGQLTALEISVQSNELDHDSALD